MLLNKLWKSSLTTICCSQMLRPEEVEMLVCGNPELDMEALKKVTVYDGYNKTDPTIRWFSFAHSSLITPQSLELLHCSLLGYQVMRNTCRPSTLFSYHSFYWRYFWEIVLEFSIDLKKKTLLFVTGSDRIPIGGLAEMEFKICKMNSADSINMWVLHRFLYLSACSWITTGVHRSALFSLCSSWVRLPVYLMNLMYSTGFPWHTRASISCVFHHTRLENKSNGSWLSQYPTLKGLASSDSQ